MRGRKPEPRQADTAAILEVPSPPKWLGDSAKAVWRRVARHLVDRRVLAETDLPLLEAFCSSAGLVRDIQERLSEDGLVTPEGRPHPLLARLNATTGQVKAMATELGLSPTARARVGQPPEEREAAEWAEMGID